MGKVWNFLVSKDGDEYRQRETLRHTKRIADTLERNERLNFIRQLEREERSGGNIKKKKCKSCGKRIKKKAKFCEYCGKKQ